MAGHCFARHHFFFFIAHESSSLKNLSEQKGQTKSSKLVARYSPIAAVAWQTAGKIGSKLEARLARERKDANIVPCGRKKSNWPTPYSLIPVKNRDS
jgi:hypothetical protein